MIRHPQKPVPPGTLVEVVSKEGGFIGRGIYNRKSNIGIRLLTENVTEHLCKEFILKKFEYAKALREDVLGIHKTSDCYRLVHGEADGLSGLIIDKFARVIVVEPYSAGYIGIMDWIVSSLKTLYPDCNVAVRPDARNAEKEGVDFSKLSRNYPCPDSVIICENNMRMMINFKSGHKTGFFLTRGKTVWPCLFYVATRRCLIVFVTPEGLEYLQCWQAQGMQQALTLMKRH